MANFPTSVLRKKKLGFAATYSLKVIGEAGRSYVFRDRGSRPVLLVKP
jgi:hypothetical protein